MIFTDYLFSLGVLMIQINCTYVEIFINGLEKLKDVYKRQPIDTYNFSLIQTFSVFSDILFVIHLDLSLDCLLYTSTTMRSHSTTSSHSFKHKSIP